MNSEAGSMTPIEAPADKVGRGRTRRDLLAEWLAGEPMVPPAVGLMAGIALDAAWGPILPLALVVFATAGGLLVFCRGRVLVRHAAVMLGFAAAGAAHHDLAFRHVAANHIVRYTTDARVPARLTGVVLTAPEIRRNEPGPIEWYQESPRTRMLVEAEWIQGREGDLRTVGMVSVTVARPVLDVQAGDRVELFGLLGRPRSPSNPGEIDWSLILRRGGVQATMSCELEENVRRLGSADRFSRSLAWLRRRARAALLQEAYLGDAAGARVLTSLVLGQRSAVKAELNDAFARTGTVHYLSVSGAHVAILLSAVWLVAVLVGGSRRGCAGVAMLAVTGYALLAEPYPAIWRAALMANVFCVSILLRRPPRSLNWLALAAVILLAISPMELFNPGFQLSFVTVAALILLTGRVCGLGRIIFYRIMRWNDPLLTPEIQHRISPPGPVRRLAWNSLWLMGTAIGVSLTAWLSSALLGLYHFRQIALWGWLNTLLVLPLVWCVMMTAIAKSVFALALPPVGGLLGTPLAWLTDALIRVVQALADLPGASPPMPTLPGWVAAAGLGVLLFWSTAGHLRIRSRWVGLAAAGWGAVAMLSMWPWRQADTLRLCVLSVGHGCTCVLHLPDGRTMIYDAGGSPTQDLARHTIEPWLAGQRVRTVDTVMISHEDLDHYSALPGLAARRGIGEIVVSPHFGAPPWKTASGDRLCRALSRRDLHWRQVVIGDCLVDARDLRIEVLWPPPIEQVEIEDNNDASLVLRLSYAGRRILLCGDIKALAQQYLMAATDLRADVLLLPHHGAVVGNTGAFIDAVDPQFCIRSGNQPDAATTNGLLKLVDGRQYFNTADDGAVEVTIRRGELRVTPYRNRTAGRPLSELEKR